MITWQKVIDVSEISGTPEADTYEITNIYELGIDGGLTATETESGSVGWFVGVSQGAKGNTNTADNANAYVQFFQRTDNFEGDFPFGAVYWTRNEFVFSDGTTSETLYGFDVTVEDGDFTVNGPSESQTIQENTSWSFYTQTLRSYELTTLFNQTGTTTTNALVEIDVVTTAGDPPALVVSKQIVDTTVATVTNTFSRETWTNTLTYETTVSTGQTTTVAYSSFANSAPLLIVEDLPTTAESTISPLSFYPQNAADGTGTTFTKTFIAEGSSVEATRTAATQGSSVIGTFPSVAPFDTKISSATLQINTTSIGEDEIINELAATTSQSRSATDLSHLVFADLPVFFIKTVSESVKELDPLGYVSTYDFLEEFTAAEEVDRGQVSFGPALRDGPQLKKFSNFGYNQVSIAHSVEVFVAAVGDGEKGASFDPIAARNSFATYTMRGVIPVSKIFRGTDSSITFFGNSYTAQIGTNPTQSGVFGIIGQSTSQWTMHNTERVKVLGGPLRGDAFIHYGLFETYCGTNSSTFSAESAVVSTWSKGEQTTALVGREAWTSTTFGENVSTVAFWNMTAQPLDD